MLRRAGDVQWETRALSNRGLLRITRREFALLRVLMEQRGRPMAREAIQQHLYGWDADVASNAVDVHVHQLRRKLEPGIIRTVRGLGYALGDLAGDAA